jgi:hypothetical protein
MAGEVQGRARSALHGSSGRFGRNPCAGRLIPGVRRISGEFEHCLRTLLRRAGVQTVGGVPTRVTATVFSDKTFVQITQLDVLGSLVRSLSAGIGLCD